MRLEVCLAKRKTAGHHLGQPTLWPHRRDKGSATARPLAGLQTGAQPSTAEVVDPVALIVLHVTKRLSHSSGAMNPYWGSSNESWN